MLCLFCTVAGLRAAVTPTFSTDDNTVWYVIQFCNGGNALTAQADGAGVKTAVPTGKASQLWKLEGTRANFKLTSKNGMVLYTTTKAANGMFHSSATASTNTAFKLATSTASGYSGEWLIAPVGTSVYMNQWGGAGSGKALGLWSDQADANQPLRFIEESEFLAEASPLPLIPYPNSVVRGEGSLAIKDFASITYGTDVAKPVAEMLAACLSMVSGKEFAATQQETAQTGAISFVNDATLAEDEYKLTVNADGVVITAATYGGYFYGMQTLKQLMPAHVFKDEQASDWDTWSVPFVAIDDKPVLGWRGFHFDVSRHFFTLDEVKKLLDAAATFKINRFHWHLTDDQGWRVEIPEYPKLTTIGAERKGSFTLERYVNGASEKFFDDTPYGKGCFYTLDQLKELVAYAKTLNIEIIPEIDLPGHMQAVLAAYPEFSCYPERTYEVRLVGGINPEVLNVGDDKVIDFLKCVLGHIAETFPYNYVHLGGDECPTTRWQELYTASGDNAIKQRMAEEALTEVGQLQPWLVQELGSWLKATYNKDVVVWDELLHFWDKDKFTFKPLIMAWNGEALANTAWATHGLESVTVPYQRLYLDFPQVHQENELIDEPYIGGWGVCTLDGIYNYNPRGMMAAGTESHMLGVQGNLWTETTSSLKEAEYQYYPRVLALSEIGWLQNDKKNWVSFYQRMQKVVKILDAKGITYAKHSIEAPEYTPMEALQVEADQLLADTKAGAVGYPSVEDVEALQTARETLTDPAALEAAIAAFKAAPLTMPQAGKFYRINSASTATRVRYNGSSVYLSGELLKIHYTPQTENEELFQFTPTEDGTGFILTHATTGKALNMGTLDDNVSMTGEGTPICLRKGVANRQYDYIPGVVVITNAADVNLTENSRNLFANYSGLLSAGADATLCYGGTWRITEVDNYADYLKSMLARCEEIVSTAKPGEDGQHTQEAIDYLTENFLAPARDAVNGVVSQEVYQQLASIYDTFMAMPRYNAAFEAIDEAYLYKIRNIYFPEQYAYATATKVLPGTGNGNDYYWVICKNDDGTITLYNKSTKTSPYISKASSGETIRMGQYYKWTVGNITTDQANSGVGIMDPSKQFSWYKDPGSPTIILRPYDWGASTWELVKTTQEVPTAIMDVISGEDDEAELYDLSGRKANHSAHGIYVTSRGEKVVK